MSDPEHGELHRIFTRACRLAPGDRPAFLDEACRGRPDLRSEIVAMLEADAGSALVDVDGPQFLAGVVADRDHVHGKAESHPDQIEEYRILRVLSEGGMGIVYEAEQDDPRRRVALKVVRPSMVTDELLRRFRREAHLLGRLRHPGIAQIFDARTADTADGSQPFFVMELVEGQRLGAFADSCDLGVRGRLDLIARICDVLQYAHDQGVVHRDLKPANILVTTVPSATASATNSGSPQSEAQPKVLDFGVARATDADLMPATLQTAIGQLIGTISYMSPEQASGDAAAIDQRSDVYSIGVILYELLCRQLPHDVRGKLIHEAIRVIREEDPSSVASFDRSLRGDVETIVATALEKDPARRYQTAAALAMDLRRYLADEPIRARPASIGVQLRKFALRNKALVGGVVATVLVAFAGAIIATRFAFLANQRADAMERASYIAGIAAANSAIEQNDYSAAAARLQRVPSIHRGWEYDYLRAQLVHHTEEWETPTSVVSKPVFAAREGWMLGVLSDGSVGAWDVQTGQLENRVKLAANGGEHANQISIHGPSLRAAVVSATGSIAVCDLTTGHVIATAPSPNATRAIHAWDAAGDRLLYQAGATWIFDGVTSRVLTQELFAYGEFNPQQECVALAAEKTISLYDIATGELLSQCQLDDFAQDLEFSPDGTRLAVACHYRNVYILDADNLDRVARLIGHHRVVSSCSWTPDGAHVVTAAADGTVRTWSAATGALLQAQLADVAPQQSWSEDLPADQAHAVVTPDGASVIAVGEHIRRFPLHDPVVLPGHRSFVYYLTFSNDSALLATACYGDPQILLWSLDEQVVRHRLRAPDGNASPPLIAFTSEGTLVAAASSGVVQWDVEDGRELPVASSSTPQATFLNLTDPRQWGPDGRLARTEAGDCFARCEGDRVQLFDCPNQSVDGAEGELSGRFEQELGVPASAVPAGQLVGHDGEVYCVTFSPDGSRIATGGNDDSVRVWDRRTSEQLLRLRGHDQYVMYVAFSPDGSLLASASGDFTVRLWDTLTPLERRRTRSAHRETRTRDEPR